MAKKPNTYHHIVPQCYLKNFAVKGKNDYVYVYNKRQNKSYTQAISHIGGADNFYTISTYFTDDTFDSKVIEKEYFANYIERKYSEVLEQVISNVSKGLTLTDDLRTGLAVHLVIQFLRSKEVRDKDEDFLNDMLPQMLSLFKEGLALEKNNPEIAKLNLGYQYDPALNHFRSSFGNEEIINTFAAELFKNYWAFYVSGTPVFYTSNFPIVVNPHVQDVRPFCMGLTQYGAELSFPISPTVMLVIWDRHYFKDKAQSNGRIEIPSDKDIRKYNWLRYLYAEQVFSHTNEFTMLDFIYNLEGNHYFFRYQ